MRKLILMMTILLGASVMAKADEGMWLLHMLKKINEAEMKNMGLNLSAEDIYDINKASLKDAIVMLNGGMCTAEVISDQGLVLTNHHCAYGAIQSFSSKENDYLTDGFWAMSKDQEMHIDDFEVSFLVRIEDVTSRVLEGVNDDMSESEREAKIGEMTRAIAAEATEGTDYNAQVKGFFYGNEYYLFVYNTYRDVRLVGAPPESVGKFGGDTDNWMWPRHTGDFSLLRIYADKDNNPADFADNNVPYTPKRHLNVSLDGVAPGDFTMIMGYPGSTDRYLSSWGVEQAINLYNPTVVEVRDVKLKTMKEHMDADKAVRIQYASKYASTANYWKYYIGQTKGLKRLNVYGKKQQIESEFAAWVAKDADRQKKYGEALGMIEDFYKSSDPMIKSNVYALEAGIIGADITLFAFRFNRIYGAAMAEDDMETRKQIMGSFAGTSEGFFKDYDLATDRDLLRNTLKMYKENVDKQYLPSIFEYIDSKFKGDIDRFVETLYSTSFLASESSLNAFMQLPAKKMKKAYDKDLAIMLGNSMIEAYRGTFANPAQEKFDKGYRLFVDGLRKMNSNQAYYPDANSTMRLTYGTVGDYYPADAVHYDFITTTDGILQKRDPSNPEFVVPAELSRLIEAEDFGRWANDNGDLVVCFISNNDITGGNSGSPVINGNGDLIGLAFDGNWEAMSGDIAFEPELQRTISVDIRYVMFCIDKLAGASNLIEEIDFVKTMPKPVEESTEVAPEMEMQN
ncbi:S46 family peptidase [Sanyastnella coralliicola]|uniref:S46 family peptidase n=1 Tax=Sanyastnella coralliicola TaxID=3069118 RepID=UPI0027B9E44E|nr:S46 family peptidase [Longitalea sp. SCSIO 12813]